MIPYTVAATSVGYGSPLSTTCQQEENKKHKKKSYVLCTLWDASTIHIFKMFVQQQAKKSQVFSILPCLNLYRNTNDFENDLLSCTTFATKWGTLMSWHPFQKMTTIPQQISFITPLTFGTLIHWYSLKNTTNRKREQGQVTSCKDVL